VKLLISKLLPASVIRGVKRAIRWPPVGRVDFGALRRLTPISSDFGMERGKPIDRFYIERFLEANAEGITGRVLEVADNRYTRQFGGARVEHSDVLHVSERMPGVTIVADLSQAEALPRDSFDCVILTQTLQFIFDVHTALSSVHRALKPGGILLATVPGICQISRHDERRWADCWRFTVQSARRLTDEAFPGGDIDVECAGNVLCSIAFLHGLAVEELEIEELEYRDTEYPLLITIRAQKTGGPG
jgi:SAM-dependent methyltransferase